MLGLIPVRVSAQSSDGPDEITLRDGGFLRGTIVSDEPGRQVVILLMGSGERRVVPWREVDRVRRGKDAVSHRTPDADQPDDGATSVDLPGSLHLDPDTSGGTTQTPRFFVNGNEVRLPTAGGGDWNAFNRSATALMPGVFLNGRAWGQPPPGTKGVVRLHLKTNNHDVQLFRILDASDDGDEIDEPLCTEPCDQRIDGRTGRFRIGGYGLMPSRSFTLWNRTGDVSLRVDPGKSSRWTAGAIIAGLGGGSVAAGATLLLIGSLAHSEQAPGTASPGGVPGTIASGAATLSVGAAAVVVGAVLMATSSTRVSFLAPGE